MLHRQWNAFCCIVPWSPAGLTNLIIINFICCLNRHNLSLSISLFFLSLFLDSLNLLFQVFRDWCRMSGNQMSNDSRNWFSFNCLFVCLIRLTKFQFFFGFMTIPSITSISEIKAKNEFIFRWMATTSLFTFLHWLIHDEIVLKTELHKRIFSIFVWKTDSSIN